MSSVLLLVFSGVAKSAGAAVSFDEIIDDFEVGLDHWHNDQLCDAVADIDSEAICAAVPAGDEQLALVIRVDQPDQVAEYDTMLMAKAGTGEDDGGHIRVFHVDRDAGRYQQCLTRIYHGALFERST